MRRAENDPDAFFRFSLGKTSLFAVPASESRSARFSGARNGCYGKSRRAADTKKAARGRPFLALPFATIRYWYSSAVMYMRLWLFTPVILY